MDSQQAAPALRFIREFSDQEAFEARGRGYLSHVLVQLGEGCLYPLFFYDAIRLQQDLEESAKQGRPFVADPGMIVLQEITLGAMKDAVEQLGREAFFDSLTPVTEDDLAAADAYRCLRSDVRPSPEGLPDLENPEGPSDPEKPSGTRFEPGRSVWISPIGRSQELEHFVDFVRRGPRRSRSNACS